ncbi:MAG: cupredoxin domain-containing protein [Rhodothermales bacterium]|nr:cupredoxin domain-containing protein [Rhodothermales bacterium]
MSRFLAFCTAALLLAACEPTPNTSNDPAATDTLAMDRPAQRQPDGANTVEVALTDFEIAMPSLLPPGPTVFRVTNASENSAHNFEIENDAMEKVFEANLEPGATEVLRVDLQPGTYEVYCPVGDHEQRGMELTLTVRDDAM